ncbi:MAG: hypothetical protein C0622_13440 [Desulfuromonas sp.]|nr:MAG: hypothetical protein C0622_13440 [Desulfuromonas sp.]
MKNRIARTTLLIGFVLGGILLLSGVAMAHGGAGMMGAQGDLIPCQGESFSDGMGHGMMGDMMGAGSMDHMANNSQMPCQSESFSEGMDHGMRGGMMGAGKMDHMVDFSRMPCQGESHSGGMGHEMMGSMMGTGGMGSMMNHGRGGHMMDLDDMRHGSMLSQANKLGLSAEQVSKLNSLRLTARKDVIRMHAEVNVARLELSDLVASENWTVKDVEPLVHKVQKLEGNIHLRHLQALNDARNILTADQLKLYSSTEHVGSSGHYCN